MQSYSHNSQDYEYDADYQAAYGRRGESATRSQTRRPRYARAGARPAVVNGLHRRRNKRWAW